MHKTVNCSSYSEIVSSYNFRTVLAKVLRLAKVDARRYSTSAFRSGRASDLLDMGVSVETIRKVGRWKSTAVYTYLRQ